MNTEQPLRRPSGSNWLSVYRGNIAKVEADAIVNAANALGWMGGPFSAVLPVTGVAESLNYATHGRLEVAALRAAWRQHPRPGEVFITPACGLAARWILHAVTVRLPAMRSSPDTVERCLDAVLTQAHVLGGRRLALPALGTGTGRVPRAVVAEIYRRRLPQSGLSVVIADLSGSFGELVAGASGAAGVGHPSALSAP